MDVLTSKDLKDPAKVARALEALTLRAERAEALAETERQRADEERRRGHREASLTRPTTLEELLEECHEHLATQFAIHPDPTKTTRGQMTSPEGKKCPTSLRPWTSFLEKQQDAFDRAYSQLHPSTTDPQRKFRSIQFYRELRKTLAGKFIGCEEHLRFFHRIAVEDMVREIMQALELPVTFENSSRPLDRKNDEVVARIEGPKPVGAVPKPANADRYCIYKGSTGQEELLLVSEYKAPHKLTKEYIRAALNTSDDMDVLEIRDEQRIGDDSREQFLYKARRLVAAAATQTYHYMLEGGCKYSCIVTGDVMVFLCVKKNDPTTLYFHVAEPTLEVDDDDKQSTFPHPKTAIGQLMSFCLMASKSPRRSEDWRHQAVSKAHDWVVNYGELFIKTPKALRDLQERIDKKLYQEDVAYQGRRYLNPSRSPYLMRKRPPPKASVGCNTPIQTCTGDHDDSDDEPWNGPDQDSPVKLAMAKKLGSQKPLEGKTTTPASKNKQQQRQYCSQACILGLVRAHPIDPACPNAASHPRSTKDRHKHGLTKQRLCFLLRQQLARTLDEDCTELKLDGARGILFQLTLQPYGYTFVGKGTIDVFVPDLRHEGRIYGRLKPLQGKSIPVCLGNIDLDVPWYDIGIQIVHMLLLSYGGTAINGEIDQLDDQIREFVRALAMRGVTHEDLEPRNILWSEELGRTIFVDFERSSMEEVKKQKEALRELSPNKNRQRKRGGKGHGAKKALPVKSAFLLEDSSDRWQKENTVLED
ncbi:MAG: hypothetical protein Q9211_000599 [Gyalolechia sp. 1 TL-2023]